MSTSPTQPSAKSPIPVRQLQEIPIRITAARRTLQIYPEGHAAVNMAMENACQAVSAVLDVQAPVFVQAGRGRISIAGVDLWDQHPACRELAEMLYDRQINRVGFQKTLARESLERLFLLLNSPADLTDDEKTQKALQEIPHIEIRFADYQGLELTIEAEIQADSENNEPSQEEAALRKKVEQTGNSGSQGGAVLKTVDQTHQTPTGTGGAGDTASESGSESDGAGLLSSEDSGITVSSDIASRIAILESFSQKLSPALRQQFKAFDFEKLARNPNFAALDQILGEKDVNTIFEALETANSRNEEISPTLVGLVGKVMNALEQDDGDDDSVTVSFKELGNLFKQTSMENLFKRENYESYVDENYDQLLKSITRQQKREKNVAPMAYSAGLGAFEPHNVRLKAAEATIRLLENEELDDRLFQSFSGHLVKEAQTGQAPEAFFPIFSRLTRLFQQLQNQDREGASTRAVVAKTGMKQLGNPGITAQAIEAVSRLLPDTHAALNAPQAVFIKALGAYSVPGVLQTLAAVKSGEQRRFLEKFLSPFPQATLSAAKDFTESASPEQIFNLIPVIARVAGRKAQGILKPFLRHNNDNIRAEATAALVQFGDAGAFLALRQAINAEDWDEAASAISLAGRNQIRACVPALTNRLKTGCFTPKALQQNDAIVRALGQIGDPAALPYLEKIARKVFSFDRDGLHRLKQVIFSNLERYPDRSLGNLLAIGWKTKDPVIQALVKKTADPQRSGKESHAVTQ